MKTKILQEQSKDPGDWTNNHDPIADKNGSKKGISAGLTTKSDICHLLLMDEIFTDEEIQILQRSTHRRSSTKCFRCRQKRIPCTYEFPKCKNCLKAGENCYAWVKGIKKPLPRSLPLYLEDRVAELEIELEKLKHHSVINNAEEQAYEITKHTAAPFLDCFDHSENDSTSVSLFSFFYFNSSSLPAPFDLMIDSNKKGNMKLFVENHPPVELKSIPRNVVKIMMASYMDLHLPQYPIFSRPVLTEILNRVLDDPSNATSFDKAVISITLAISAALITNRSEKRALSSSSALFSTTILQIMETSWEFKMRKLQMTLLIAHYAFTNPFAADVWLTLRDALRLCIDMGLHKEVESEVVNVFDVDDRRRLFLVCSGMLRHISAVLRIKFPIPQPLISVEYPTIIDDSYITENGIDYTGPQTKAAALHFYSFRLCETEVCEVLWHNKEINGTVEEWMNNIEKRIDSWYIKAEEFAKINQMRFRLISKVSLQTRLRRRTPRVPKPSQASFVKLINAISVHVDEYMRDAQTGQVSYLLMGVYYLEEAAINLLDVLWFESDWIFDFFTLEFLDSKLKNCIQLLEKFNERWPDIPASKMTNYLEGLRIQVIEKNQSSSAFDPVSHSKISSQIDYLIFPHNGKSSSVSSPFIKESTFSDIQSGMNLFEEDVFLSKGLDFTGKSNWQDHFTDENFWNIQDLLNNMQDYI